MLNELCTYSSLATGLTRANSSDLFILDIAGLRTFPYLPTEYSREPGMVVIAEIC